MHQILKAMMTKEEVAQVIAYCDESKISCKQRLSELGISPWNLYDARSKYAPKEEGDNEGELLQLIPGESFLPNPIKPSRSRSSKQKDSAQETVEVKLSSGHQQEQCCGACCHRLLPGGQLQGHVC